MILIDFPSTSKSLKIKRNHFEINEPKDGNINGILMKGVSFLVSFCDVMGIIFALVSDLGLVSVVKGGPGLNKMQKGRTTVKKGVPK